MTGNTVTVILVIILVIVLILEEPGRCFLRICLHNGSRNTASLGICIHLSRVGTGNDLSIPCCGIRPFRYIDINRFIINPVLQFIQCIRNGSSNHIKLVFHPVNGIPDSIEIGMKGIGCIVQCIRNSISLLAQIILHGIHFIIKVIQNVIQFICHLIHASGDGFNI